MNRIEKFYREKEILGHLKKWTTPLSVEINEDRETVEIGFCSQIGCDITKDEKVVILKIISLDLVFNHGIKDIFNKLEKRLKSNLKELKDKIRKDLGIVKGGDYIEN
jgi:ABC-type enterochelin transport system substrate-binding protein